MRPAARSAFISPVTPVSEIRAALDSDRFDLKGRETEIKEAALVGCLVWTSKRLRTTNVSCIDAVPMRECRRCGEADRRDCAC